MSAELTGLLENGRLAEVDGNVREALVRYEAAVKLDPTDLTARLRLGTLCHRIRDYVRARAMLDEARRIDRSNAEVAFRLGLACDALGDREDARGAYTDAMMLAPGSWQTWFLIGRDHRQLGHAEIARLAYRRALDVSANEPEVLSELGSLLWEMGLRDDAYPLIQQAVKACSVDAALVLQLGLADMERGDLMAAQRNIMLAKHLDPGDRRIDMALEALASRRSDRTKRRRKRAA
jgi:Flp pilus assembly protein TadD